ncbi:MAG: hypothetical protein SOV58_05905 [Candidatus Enteromonas sp.]|nr:hypothetical protein [Candidatus Enteromonas sp.]
MKALKNFLWWLFGFVSSFVLVGAAGFIAIGVVPVGAYFNNVENKDDYVSPDLQNQSLLSILTNLGSYGVSDVPFVKESLKKAMEENDLDKYFTVDWEALDGIRFNDFANIGGVIQGAIEVTATLNTLDMGDALGDLGKISVMNNWDVLTAEEKAAVDPSAPDFLPELYYYKTGDLMAKRAASTGYERVFDKEGNMVDAAKDADWYYPALKDVNLLDLLKVIGRRLVQNKAIDLISSVTPVEEDSILVTVLGEHTIADLGSINAGDVASDIKLIDVFPYDGNEAMYDMILGATDPSKGLTKDNITIGDLNGLEPDNVKLTVLLGDYASNKSTYDILFDASGKTTGTPEDLTLGDVKNLNMDNILLKSVLGDKDSGNEMLYDVLVGACKGIDPAPTWETLTLGNIKSANLEDTPLNAIISETEAGSLKDVLEDLKAPKTWAELTVSDIKGLNLESVHLVNIIPNPNSVVVKVLVEATGGDTSDYDASFALITLGQLSGDTAFNIDLVHLATVLANPDPTIKDILTQGSGKAWEDLTLTDLSSFSTTSIKLSSVLSLDESSTLRKILVQMTGVAWENITLGNLSSGTSTDNIALTTVLPFAGNEGLYNCLLDAIDDPSIVTADQITIGSLNHFDMTKIKISTVLQKDPSNPSAIMDAIIDSGCTLGELGSTVNSLTLYEVYGQKVFTTVDNTTRHDKYVRSVEDGKVVYTYNPSATGEVYYIDPNSSIWSLFAFSITKDPSNGRGIVYTESTTSISELEGSATRDAIQNATIYQLIAAGLITETTPYGDALTKLTLKEVIDKAALIS